MKTIEIELKTKQDLEAIAHHKDKSVNNLLKELIEEYEQQKQPMTNEDQAAIKQLMHKIEQEYYTHPITLRNPTNIEITDDLYIKLEDLKFKNENFDSPINQLINLHEGKHPTIDVTEVFKQLSQLKKQQ